jgi:TonB family protein
VKLFQIVIALVVLATAIPVQSQEPTSKPAQEPAPVIVPPQLKQFVHARYPLAALETKQEAAVNLLVVIDAEGKVTDVQVETLVGDGFDEAAVAAVRQFSFVPAYVDGEPVPVRIGYTYRFKVERKEVKAEPGQVITGSIKEKGVGLPVVGAEVTLEGKARTTTDNKGRFTLRRIEPGTYKVFVTHGEYRTLESEMVVAESKTLEVKLLLEPVIANPYEVVVTGKKQEAVVTKYTLERRTLETVPGTFGDPVRVVETLPGVARTSYSAGFLVIRGANPAESKVFVDGVDVPLIYHFIGGPSVLNPNFLDSIAYYPGNFPTRYGQATAGIVDVVPTRQEAEVFSGEVDVNVLNAGVYLEGPVTDKGVFRLGARRSYVDGVLAAAFKIMDRDGVLVAPVYYDFQGQFGWKVNDEQRLNLFYLGSFDSLELITSTKDQDFDIDLSTQTNFHRVIGTWQYATEKFSASVKPYFGADTFSIDTLALSFDADLYIVGGRAETTYRPVKWLQMTSGVEGGVGINSLTGKLPKPRDYYHPGSLITGGGQSAELEVETFTVSDNYYRFSPYLDLQFEPLKGLTFTPGFRFEVWHHPGGNVLMYDPRFVARWEVGGGVSLKGGVGRFSRPPDAGSTDAQFGNPGLGPQWAMHYSGGLEWRPFDDFIIDLQGFYVDSTDLVTPVDGFSENADGEIVSKRFSNGGFGRSYGMELLIKRAPTDFFYGWISYTLSRSELAGYDFVKGDVAAGGNTFDLQLSPFDQTHILSLVGSFRFGRGWETGLRMRLVSGNPITPISGGRFMGDMNGYSPITGRVRSDRLSPFFQVDLRIEKVWTFDRWIMSTYLDIQNVTNHPNSEFFVWDYRFNKGWKVPGIPILPSLGISGRF